MSEQDLFADCLNAFFESVEAHCLSLLSSDAPPKGSEETLPDLCTDEAKLDLAGDYLCAWIDKASFRGRAFFVLGFENEKQGENYPLFQCQIALQFSLSANPHYRAILANTKEKTALLRGTLNKKELALVESDQRQSPWSHPGFEALMYQTGRRFCRYFCELYGERFSFPFHANAEELSFLAKE